MNKIGQVTLYSFNYGSALQCFATQYYFQKYGIECQLLIEQSRYPRSISLLKRACRLSSLILRNPTYAKKIIDTFLSGTSKSLKLSPESIKLIKNFVNVYIQRKVDTYRNFETMAKGNEYIGFISGSDQIWNGASLEGHNMSFLRFAPKQKRLAWAPSFGGNQIEKYNIKKFQKYIKEYHVLSARENSGKKIMEEISGKKVELLSDPVFLLNSDEWRDVYQKTNVNIPSDRYVFIFFIDRPSDKAKSKIKSIAIDNPNISFISFGYKYPEYFDIKNYYHIDGDPFAFLSYIDHADMIITDSFHATAFSLIFHKEFLAFSRQYTHAQNQSVRITELLAILGQESRYEPKDAISNLDYKLIDHFIFDSQLKAEIYVKNNLIKGDILENNMSPYINKSLCCGCGACADVCGKKAIQMIKDSEGHLYPYIDHSLCVKCGRCAAVCQYRASSTFRSNNHHAYVAVAKENINISRSSSGGIFPVLSHHVLSNGGIAFGAAVVTTENSIKVCHIGVDNEDKLPILFGSKYVQSETTSIFKRIKNELLKKKKVIFCGTSCQVAGLYSYLGRDYDNLFTVDLICHGVPSQVLFDDYLHYIEKHYKSKAKSYSFRQRSVMEPYCITIKFTNNKKVKIKMRSSAFYRLFMAREGYRPSCYSCKYATIHKPSDITLGDFYLKDWDKHELGISDDFSGLISCVITNTSKGEELLSEVRRTIKIAEIPLEYAINHHEQLYEPSSPSNPNLYTLYKQKGIAAVQNKIYVQNVIRFIPSKIKGIIHN